MTDGASLEPKTVRENINGQQITGLIATYDVYVYMYTCIYTYVCIHICMYISYIYIYLYVYTHMYVAYEIVVNKSS